MGQSLIPQSQLFWGTRQGAMYPVAETTPLPVGAMTSFADQVALGMIDGVTAWEKFGTRHALVAATGYETIWERSGNFTPQTTADTYVISYDGTGGGSTDGAGTTGARSLLVDYIDSAGLYAQTTHVLGTDGSDTTAFTGLGINRSRVVSAGTVNKNASAISFATTGGAQAAIIPTLQGITKQAIFHVGSNDDAVASLLFLNVGKGTGGGTPIFNIRGFVYNRTTGTEYVGFEAIVDTANQGSIPVQEPAGFLLLPTDVVHFAVDTTVNDSEIHARFSLRSYARS